MDGGAATRQGQVWGRAAHDWAELQEPMGEPLWEAMLDAAAVGAGTRLLDAGCGAGGASVLAVGRGALVTGLDAAPALLTIARERVPDGAFREGDLAALPYADETFDAVLAADVLPYVADPLAALRELHRVCAPGGRVVLALWGTAEECEQYAIVTAVRALLLRPLDGEQGPLGRCGSVPAALDTLIEQARLRMLSDGTVACPAEYPDSELAWQAQASAGPLQDAMRAVGEQRLKAAVLRALAPYRTIMGGVRMHNQFRYVAACPASGLGPGRAADGNGRKGDEPM